MARAMAESNAAVNAEEAFAGPLAGQEFAVARIDVAGQQMRAVRIGARQDQRRHIHDVGGQPRRHQFLDRFADVGTKTLPPRCPHFFAEESWSSK